VVFSKARAPHRGDGGEARKVVLGREQQPSKPSSHPNQTQAAAHLSVTAGRNALGTIEQVEGGFVTTSTARAFSMMGASDEVF
jgi:hypothetical protein